MIGAVNCCWVWYKLPEGIKAAWSLSQAYYYHHYSGGPTEILPDFSNKVKDWTVIRDSVLDTGDKKPKGDKGYRETLYLREGGNIYLTG